MIENLKTHFSVVKDFILLNKRPLIHFAVFSMVISFGQLIVRPGSIQGDIETQSIGDYLFIAIFGILSSIVYLYFFLKLLEPVESPRASSNLLFFVIRRLPSLLVTILFILIRLIPYWLLAVIGAMIPTVLQIAFQSDSNIFLNISIIVTFVLVLFGMVRVVHILPVATVTKYQFWSATKIGIKVYKQNTLHTILGIVPFLVVYAATIVPIVIISVTRGENLMHSSSMNIIFTLLLIPTTVFYLANQVIIFRRHFDKEEFQAI